ncbi:amino acid adenylation domain-containing protein [Paenibacillus peoriae]|uniref:Amino acid adenylation domain-containing protein n=2 Tax=Paenibacillus TaxID=44249 RepID=A0A7H0Y775_9BACL|nr:non-ribosomal peptide synthetase [Paenibacillus peoriae]QNR66933.1 amino acid adenylation domain-containing protein [Paenibacillus peoriae]
MEIVMERREYPLSHPQKRIWYMSNVYDNSSLYSIGGYLKLNGPIDFQKMEQSIQHVVKSNSAFHLRFVEREESAVQYLEVTSASIDFLDFSVYSNAKEEFFSWSEQEMQKPFLLTSAPLYYVAMFKISDHENGIFLKMHHLISDGWSFGLVGKKICSAYEQYVRNINADEQFDDAYFSFIEREQAYLASKRFLKDQAFWNDKYMNIPESMTMSVHENIKGKRQVFLMDDTKSSIIRAFADRHHCSVNTFFIALFFTYLSTMQAEEELVIGIPLLNRPTKMDKEVIGMYTGTMAFRYDMKKGLPFHELLKDVHKEISSCFMHHKFPYDLLVKDLTLTRQGYNSLFKHCINFYNTSIDYDVDGMSVELVEQYNGSQPYELQMVVDEWNQEGKFTLAFDYLTSVYSDDQILDLWEYLMSLIDCVVLEPCQPIEKIDVVQGPVKQKLIYDFNATEAIYPCNRDIGILFEEQVDRSPGRIALTFKDEELTYWQLNAKANQLARKLQMFGVEKGSRVGIVVTHSLEMVIGIMGVIKAGAVYVPIDSAYPIERINYMLRDSQISIILTNMDIEERFEFKGEIVQLDNPDLYSGESGNLGQWNTPHDLAYVIYTSGSTGVPKGVMVEHRGLTNYIWWARKMYINHWDEAFALYSSISFDLTVTSLFTPLINGNQIHIYDDDGSEFVLYKILRENKTNILKLTPSHLSLLKDTDYQSSTVKRFIVGGEDLKCSLAAQIHRNFNDGLEIYNEYGPTETVVGCMIYRFQADMDTNGSVPIGKPADNVQIYILDQNHKPVPVGFAGELYISGDGVARGYMNQTELTRQRFIPNPFHDGCIMYKTGDLARFRRDGNIEYIGRGEEQVKIRGHRIELGEIAEQLLKMNGIYDAVVVNREDKQGKQQLYAYYTSLRAISDREIKNHLRQFLPGYMIPAFMERLEQIPLTVNGKVNTRQLPEPQDRGQMEYVAYRNEKEEILVKVIQEVLNVERIGMTDDFYELGGDSIKAIQIANKLNASGWVIKVKELMSHTIIEEMAVYLKSEQVSEAEQGPVEGEIGFNPIAKWFFAQHFSNSNHWNQSLLLKIDPEVTCAMLEQGFRELIRHHDALRMNYDEKLDHLYYNSRYLRDDYEFRINEVDIRDQLHDQQDVQMSVIGSQLKSSLSITRDVLLKAVLIHLGPVRGDRLLITAHHLIMDGVSWTILVEDLNRVVQQQRNGLPVELSPKTHALQVWNQEMQNYGDHIQAEEREYWRQVCRDRAVYPIDYDRGADRIDQCAILQGELNEIDTQRLTRSANAAYGTEAHELLLIALVFAATKNTGQSKVTFELEGHGREEISNRVNISRTIGWFTSMYPVNLYVESDSLSSQIKGLKEQIRHVPKKGLDYGILTYMQNEIDENSDKHIRFNYLGDLGASLNQTVFASAKEDSGNESDGANHLTSLMDINVIIIEGKLSISIQYSRNKFKSETVAQLLAEFIAQIQRLLDHCCNKESREFTPSDFDAIDLEQADLDILFAEVWEGHDEKDNKNPMDNDATLVRSSDSCTGDATG